MRPSLSRRGHTVGARWRGTRPADPTVCGQRRANSGEPRCSGTGNTLAEGGHCTEDEQWWPATGMPRRRREEGKELGHPWRDDGPVSFEAIPERRRGSRARKKGEGEADGLSFTGRRAAGDKSPKAVGGRRETRGGRWSWRRTTVTEPGGGGGERRQGWRPREGGELVVC
ncbi:hypothetical protein E2562_027998 [Oryza meyeriana var. granulata]|uniref:DUF834 domain-containing protein n=1 Tax=Oryza meyeriana var. granulata TaxID=110450 RepID=A0A6G1CVL1_9ORYZ|nr:hypothetical protein E2562_027998 [Oryza meyeriana var. granulata]